MKVKSFSVAKKYRIGFDHSYNSFYEASHYVEVELEPGEQYNNCRDKVEAALRDRTRREAEEFKAEHDLPRNAGLYTQKG